MFRRYKTAVENMILEKFGRPEPTRGCSFIATNGEFVNIYPRIDDHTDSCEWVEDNSYYRCKYVDEEYFVREFGFIRLRYDPTMIIIELPKEINSSMWYSLQDYLEFVDDISSMQELTAEIQVCDKDFQTIRYNGNTGIYSEDIIHEIDSMI